MCVCIRVGDGREVRSSEGIRAVRVIEQACRMVSELTNWRFTVRAHLCMGSMSGRFSRWPGPATGLAVALSNTSTSRRLIRV